MRSILLVPAALLTLIGFLVLPTVSQQTGSSDVALFPPNAKPGECYAKVQVPAKYETYSEELIKRQAGEKIEVIPPKFELVEEKVIVKDATYKLELVPAQYETIEEKVLVKPAYEVLEQVPAAYEKVEEKILVKPAQTVWKKGRGPIEKIDGSTGEILCLIEEPPVYKTLTKRVLKSPAKVVKKEVPAEYKVVKKTVMKAPPTTKKIEIPAEYKTVKVKKQVVPAQEKRMPIPEERQTVTKTKKIGDSSLEWRPILCETNMTVGIVKNIQTALKKSGYYGGPIDGVVGAGTVSGLRSFQNDKGIATGGITMETIKMLGVKL